MRSDAFIASVLDRCDALRKAGLWPSEQHLRPREWLRNFDEEDQLVAATLLNSFEYCNGDMTGRLLQAAYDSLGDQIPKCPSSPSASTLLAALPDAVFTPIEGESPSVTDSGNYVCRMARQRLGIPEDRIMDPAAALAEARTGQPVVFLDDFVGSGDQFLTTWRREYYADEPVSSFSEAQARTGFVAAIVTAVSMAQGADNIWRNSPTVAFAAAHVLDASATYRGLAGSPSNPLVDVQAEVLAFLWKYRDRLEPKDDYMYKMPEYLVLGYKNGGLLFGFEHSVPDATLPIFWSPGTHGWKPLVERT